MGRQCICRTCGKHYDEDKSRADYTGFCSQRCLHKKAKALGYRHREPGDSYLPSEWRVLHRHGVIGSVYVEPKKP